MPNAAEESEKKKDWKKVASNWIVIIIMVGSILGFAIIASQGSQPPPEQLPPTGPPTTLGFSAESVDANVVQVLNTMLVTASTRELEIDKIDAALHSVEGILGFVEMSAYRQYTDTSIASSKVYVVPVFFEQGYSAKQLSDKIAAIELLDTVEVAPYALLSLPQTVTLRNNDLNLIKEHTFSDPLVQAYISIDTIENDNIIVALQMTFAGENPVERPIVYEQYNLTASPKMLSLAQEFSVDAMQPRLSFEAGTTYGKSLSIDFNNLEREIHALDGAESVSMDVSEAFPSMLVELDGDYTSLEQDINSLLNDLNGINTTRFYLDQNAFSLQFDLEADFILLEADILDGLEDLNIGITQLREPPVNVHGDLNVSSGSAAAVVESINGLFRTRRLEVKLRQYASFTAGSLKDPDTNSLYTVEEGSFEALIAPTYNPGGMVELDIVFYSVRDKVIEIQAEEAMPETGQ